MSIGFRGRERENRLYKLLLKKMFDKRENAKKCAIWQFRARVTNGALAVLLLRQQRRKKLVVFANCILSSANICANNL